MSLYRRGDVWWYKFWFNGQLIRESLKSGSKTVAKGVERARRRELEQAYNHIPKRERMPLFAHAADLWLASNAGLAQKSQERYEHALGTSRKNSAKDSSATWMQTTLRSIVASASWQASATAP